MNTSTCTIAVVMLASTATASAGDRTVAAGETDRYITSAAPDPDLAVRLAAWLATRRLGLGGDSGVDVALGDLSRELRPGAALRLSAAFDLGYVPFLRPELAIGFASAGRSVEAARDGLIRFPLTVGVLGLFPMATFFGADAARYPEPYLRIATGTSPTFVTRRDFKTRADEGAAQAVFLWGLGARYAMPFSWWPKGLLAHLDITHTVQVDRTAGNFLAVTIGVEKELAFDGDGDSAPDADRRDGANDGAPAALEDRAVGAHIYDVTDGADETLPEAQSPDGQAQDDTSPQAGDGDVHDDGSPDVAGGDRDGTADAPEASPEEPKDSDAAADEDGSSAPDPSPSEGEAPVDLDAAPGEPSE